jgi:hypothetical protein
MPSPAQQERVVSATTHARHLLYLVETASQALDDAIQQAEKFLGDMEQGRIDLPRLHVAVTDELRYLKQDLTGKGGYEFEIEYTLKLTRDLVALCELA